MQKLKTETSFITSTLNFKPFNDFSIIQDGDNSLLIYFSHYVALIFYDSAIKNSKCQDAYYILGRKLCPVNRCMIF